MKKWKKIIFFALLLFVLGYIVWCNTGRATDWKNSEAYIEQTQLISTDSACYKNIVAIQPYMVTSDYSSEKHFYQKMKLYFEEAKRSNFLNKNTVVVLPEYIGTWLVVAGEKQTIFRAPILTDAMTTIVLSNPLKIIYQLLKGGKEKDVFAAAIFRMKAKNTAQLYSAVFKQLALEYKVTINAGSIVLPGPSVAESIVVDELKPLYNCSFIFYNDGSIDEKVVKKTFLTSSEQPFLTSFPMNELPVFDLPIGKTALVVCADSWFPETYEQINKLNPDVVLVNSFCSGNKTMEKVWKGYDGYENPKDVIVGDINKITEHEAWLKYSLPGRIKSTQVPVGATIFLRGDLWDMGSDSKSPFFVKNNKFQELKTSDKAGIWSICF